MHKDILLCFLPCDPGHSERFFSPRQRKEETAEREEEGEEEEEDEVFLGGGELQLCAHPVRGVAPQLQTPLRGLLLRLRPPFSVRE